MNSITLFDVTHATWTPNTSASVNPVPSDQYLSQNASDGSLVALSVNTKEMAGGLISTSCELPVGSYFGLDVDWLETPEDFAHKSRNEMDLKITLAGGKQANGSCQWNATSKQWQLDPSGGAWANTGFTQAPILGPNRFQSRWWTDGVYWSCAGLKVNGVVWTPTSAFQNISMISTNWTPGLHPQLQMECQNVPWFLRCQYARVWVLGSAGQIGW